MAQIDGIRGLAAALARSTQPTAVSGDNPIGAIPSCVSQLEKCPAIDK